MSSNIRKLAHQFVEFVPADLRDGVLYISVDYATATHRCCCGCGNEVVTPLSPSDWKIIFDGQTVSLNPSIGNWGFACRSHYWIKHNTVVWAEEWSLDKIDLNRKNDQVRRSAQYQTPHSDKVEPNVSVVKRAPIGFWSKIKSLLSLR